MDADQTGVFKRTSAEFYHNTAKTTLATAVRDTVLDVYS